MVVMSAAPFEDEANVGIRDDKRVTKSMQVDDND